MPCPEFFMPCVPRKKKYERTILFEMNLSEVLELSPDFVFFNLSSNWICDFSRRNKKYLR